MEQKKGWTVKLTKSFIESLDNLDLTQEEKEEVLKNAIEAIAEEEGIEIERIITDVPKKEIN